MRVKEENLTLHRKILDVAPELENLRTQLNEFRHEKTSLSFWIINMKIGVEYLLSNTLFYCCSIVLCFLKLLDVIMTCDMIFVVLEMRFYRILVS